MPGSRFWSTAVIILCAVALGAQEAKPFEPPKVTDPRATYIVGFAELSAVDLPAEYRYIATSLPRLIVESFDSGAGPGTAAGLTPAGDPGPAGGPGLASTTSHTYSAAELESYAQTLISTQERLALRALSAAVRQRDALLFEKNVTQERREAAQKLVTDSRTTLDALRVMDSSGPEIQSVKPIEFWSGRALGRLLAAVAINDDLEPDPASLREIAERADLDLLIWGVVEEIRGYLKVDLYAYSPYGSAIDLGKAGTVALPSDIGQEAEIIAGEVAATLLGRPWGSVTVKTNVNDAAILVDDRLVGYRQADARYLVPGEASVEVVANGYRTERRTVTVADRQTTELVFELVPIVERLVRVESAPAGADVYVDSVWTGTTPLDVSVSSSPLIVRLRREGYLESRFVLDSESPDRVARALLPDSLVWANELREKRDSFYRSMSWFVVSVPVTMILNGVYQSVYGAFPPVDGGELTPENRLAFARLGNIFYWASSGGLLVNLALLVNVGINLFDYLAVGEGAHNQ